MKAGLTPFILPTVACTVFSPGSYVPDLTPAYALGDLDFVDERVGLLQESERSLRVDRPDGQAELERYAGGEERDPERARQRMNAHRSSLHVQTVRGDLRVPNLWSAHYTRMGAVAPQRLGQ